MGISDRVIVLNFGQKIADDIPAKIQEDEAVLSGLSPQNGKERMTTAAIKTSSI